MFKFRNSNIDIEGFLISQIEDSLMLPSNENKDIVEYFSNGDKMTVNLKTKEIDWNPINPGSMSTSKLSLRIHQWFGKGLIEGVREDN